MMMCSSRVLLILESSARARWRSHRSRADVCDLSPVGGCKYERYVRYVSTDEQYYFINFITLYKSSGVNCLKISDVAQGSWFRPSFCVDLVQILQGYRMGLCQIGPAGINITSTRTV